MASLHDEANAHYRAIKHDATAKAAVRTAFATLSSARLTGDKGGLDITSATVNGQSFAGTIDLSKGNRMLMLDRVIQMLDHGGPIPKRTRPNFSPL